MVNQREYYAHEHTKRLNNEEQDYLKELLETKANTNNVAACLNRKTGKHFNGQDVRNLIRKINDTNSDEPKSEDILTKIKNDGGFVSYTRDENNFVDVLFIQTSEMVRMLKKRETKGLPK